MVKCGVVGCGVIAPTHIAGIKAVPNAELEALCDINPERLNKLADANKVSQAVAALQQAVPAETVRKNLAEKLTEKAMLEELHAGNIKREPLTGDYWLLTGSKHLFLTSKDAITYTALPLDETLKNAIGNALQEALAKARLAETLKKEFNDKKIVFY